MFAVGHTWLVMVGKAPLAAVDQETCDTCMMWPAEMSIDCISTLLVLWVPGKLSVVNQTCFPIFHTKGLSHAKVTDGGSRSLSVVFRLCADACDDELVCPSLGPCRANQDMVSPQTCWPCWLGLSHLAGPRNSIHSVPQAQQLCKIAQACRHNGGRRLQPGSA